jgi:hypothetical protein
VPFTDASTVLLEKLATFLPDEEGSGASELVPGSVRGAIRWLDVGGRLTLTPEVLWFAAHPLNYAPRTRFGIPVEEIVRLDDVSSGLRRKVRVTMQSGMAPARRSAVGLEARITPATPVRRRRVPPSNPPTPAVPSASASRTVRPPLRGRPAPAR